jgi:cytochrome c oxidase subunit IV
MSSYDFAEHEEYQEHVVPYTVYLAVFGALMVLTAVTVTVAFWPLGTLNFPVAISIAITKATLVVLFFMHVKYASTITKLVVISSLVWLGFLFFITLSDYLTRGWLVSPPIPR